MQTRRGGKWPWSGDKAKTRVCQPSCPSTRRGRLTLQGESSRGLGSGGGSWGLKARGLGAPPSGAGLTSWDARPELRASVSSQRRRVASRGRLAAAPYCFWAPSGAVLHSALVAQRAETSGSTCVTTWREGALVQTLPHPPTGCDAGTGGQDFASHSRCGVLSFSCFFPP